MASQQKETVLIKDEAVEEGLETYKWMTETGIPALAADYHALGKRIAKIVKDTNAYKSIDGLPSDADFQYAILYRAMPPSWLSDASIRALCVKTKRTWNGADTVLSDDIRDCVLRQVKEEEVESVFLPLNFDNLYWCCVVVKVKTTRIYYYDPLNHTLYKNAVNAVAVRLKLAG
ncbi:hypothetical protein F443_06891 [Phytophthora nicotianae P1569]|uniref:Ubiquitin-like protease family profile domain-containing protein n=1 Tax=Phytophthora nicotianae P1569 TaxID=1317065 RepID=V9FDK7_PHYNI|nr:hypothetical protein F443_06891 [Phytophthora nicotianae P1569]